MDSILPNWTTGSWDTGGRGGGGGNAYGTVPSAPSATPTGAAATSAAMAAGNTAYMQLPGYGSSLGNVGANINSETAGQLPADVIRQMQQQAAERGIASGAPGSDNNNAAYLRALGLTSLNLTDMGQKNLQSILPSLPGSQISQNPNFYPTAGQNYEAELQRAIYQSAPDPAAAAAAAMAAAHSGLTAGRNSVGMPNLSPPVTGNNNGGSDFWNGGYKPQPVVGSSQNGTYINGQYYEQGQGPMSQQAVDDILRKYDPSNLAGTGWGDPNADWYGPDYGSNGSGGSSGGGSFYAGANNGGPFAGGDALTAAANDYYNNSEE